MRALASSLALPLLLALAAGPASAQSWLMGEMKLDEPRRGTLLFATEEPEIYRVAPGLETDVTIRVTGVVARTTVVQRFRNPTEDWQEGVYVFPLPEDSAVDTLRVVIGERVIVGVVKEKEEARKAYVQAKQEGKKAALVEEERPDMFMTSVANIGPGEQVDVHIEYQEKLAWDAEGFSLRYPLTLSKRYTPGAAPAGTGPSPGTTGIPSPGTTPAPSPASTGDHAAPASAGEEASPGSPDTAPPANPVAAPGEGPTVRIRVELDAGFPLAEVRSPSHAIESEGTETRAAVVTLAEDRVPADRDFVLEWKPEQGREPRSALFTQVTSDATYALLMVQPPRPDPDTVERIPRETIFVVDSSGSMNGERMVQAREALDLALARLDPADRFDVIDFDSEARALHGEPVPATPEAVQVARQWVGELEAEGGTNMMGALQQALPAGWESDLLRQVIFVTDGAVSNEAQLFAYIRQHLGKARLFTVGIGSAPNAHFMTRAARAGRGSFTYVAERAEVAERMGALFQKLENPVLKDLEVVWMAASTEAWPRAVPDLYLGEPVVVAARLDEPGEEVLVRGQGGGRPFEWKLPLAGGDENPGVARLWAREKIDALLSGLHPGVTAPAAVKQEVVEVALAHHLVSKHTSLVAIEETPSRPEGEELVKRRVPALPPKDKAPPPPPAPVKPVPEPRTWALILLVMGWIGYEQLRGRGADRPA